MAWTLLLADRAGNQLGELRNATNRVLRFPLNAVPTVTFSVDAYHPFATLLVQDDLTLVKAYDDSTGSKVLRFYGPITSHRKTLGKAGGNIDVTASGAGWRLAHRLIGKNPAGATFGTTAVSLLDRGEIMRRVVNAVNQGEASNVFADADDTGIRPGTITASSSTYIGGWRYKPAQETFAELSAPLDGPDWEIVPTEPVTDGTGLQIGLLNIAAAIGTVQPNVAFEYGDGHNNVESWTDDGDANTLCNRASNLPPGFPDSTTQAVLETSDETSRLLRGLHEALIPADLTSDDLRQKLIAEHVRVRRTPRRIISFQPIAEGSSLPLPERRVPRVWADYIPGDTIVFRATEAVPVIDSYGTVIGERRVKTVDALVRIFAVDLALDDNGTATPTLTIMEA